MNFEELFKQIIAFSKNLNKKQKIVIGITIGAFVLLISFLVVYNSSTSLKKDNYSVLFENLKPKDAALIAQYLDKKKISYVIPSDGIIEVPKDKVEKLRIEIAAQGLPKASNVGFELFNKNSFGATAFEEKIKYLRALEGELANTVEAIDAVEEAKVNIALPKESVFVSKQTPPSASVMIKLKPNMILTPKQIKGIKYLVAAAVPKLKPENVKIIDQYGNLLGENDELSSNNELLRTEILYKKRLEKELEDKITSILAPIVGGDDKIVAKVNLDIDFSKVKSHSTIYSPDNVVRSEQTVDEEKTGYGEKKVGGVPGAVSNIGPVQGSKSNQIKNKYTKSEDTTNYEISTTIKDTIAPLAKIKRVTAAVVVDGNYKKDKNGKIVFVPLDKIELANINNLVKNTIGFDSKRGDSVSVSCFQFNHLNSQKKSSVENIMDNVQVYLGPVENIIKYLILLIILFVFYKKVIAPFSQKMLEVKSGEEIKKPKKTLEIEEEEEENTYDKIKELKEKVETQLGISSNVDEEELKYDVLLERITKMVEDKTQDVAKVLENLLKEEEHQKGI
ncbi:MULTISPECIES: flagellar basal-body MS-ring/collar protein FliF [unclassified Lebetimonas]|uniref:flagellar basal-body MS-ring/collar protein FliF n=1 Tax=unclassified Lebetimonas TaxID=2648158 RepID=UPI0004675D46|nr:MULTISPECIES: flagellar basal-body MS-ring/collar protein FliF [unclassified Lebetimonas]